MKILICIATMESGGAERQVAYLSRYFSEFGYEIHVAMMRGGPNLQRLVASGATIHMINLYPFSNGYIFPLIKLFSLIKPDIIYLWQRPFDVLGALAAFITRNKFVLAERTDPETLKFTPKVFLRNLLSFASSGVICNSQAGVDYWSKRLPDRVPVVRISNIIPIDELQSVSSQTRKPRSVVTVGRLDEAKNTLTLLKAAAQLNHEGIPFFLSIVGSGPLSETFEAFILEHNLSEKVVLCGHVNNVWSILKGSSVFVSLSLREGEPNAVLEAAALGCDLILSDIPAHRDIASSARASLVDPTSIEEVGRALVSLLGTNNLKDDTDTIDSDLYRRRSASMVVDQHTEFFTRIMR